jgi:FkbM family methyltransferase
MTTRSNNVKMACDKYDKRIIPIEILNFDTYEKEALDMILRLIENDSNVFDIGANIGWYSINIAKTKKDVDVFSFEPIPKTYDYLVKNVSLNNISNVRPHNFGFSHRGEDLEFYYYPEGSGNASIANLSENNGAEKITCQVKKLDDFVRTNKLKVDFIKCDVEGAELLVFQGGIETIKNQKPIVFAELLRKWSAKFNYHPNEVVKLFRNIDYRCFTAKSERLIEFFKMDDQTTETNFFFLHSKKHKSEINKLLIREPR